MEIMSDTPKFEVIDRRRTKAAEEQEQQPQAPAASSTASSDPSVSTPGPRLVVTEGGRASESPASGPAVEREQAQEQAADELPLDASGLPPAPTAEEAAAQKAAYLATTERIDELIRAQNPAAGAPPAAAFEHLVQQFYLSAMIAMGAGSQEGQRARVDLMGARGAIDLLGVIEHKTQGNLSEAEQRTLETVLFDLRLAFLEVTRALSMQAMHVPPAPGQPLG